MTKTIFMHQVLGKRDVPGDVGIEVEVEGTTAFPEVHNTRWEAHHDNSLRGFSMEYTSAKPQAIDKVLPALEELHKLVKDSYVKSRRASVHVHLNILRHTPLQLWSAVVAYWFMEHLLFEKFIERSRRNNVFCLRLSDAEGVVDQALRAINERNWNRLGVDQIRYSALNINAIPKFGSIEARAMHSTIDPKEIRQWASTLHTLVNLAKGFKHPADLVDFYWRHGYAALVERLIPTHAKELLALPNSEELAETNLPPILEFAYAPDWEEYADYWVKQGAVRPATNELPLRGADLNPDIWVVDDLVNEINIAPIMRGGR